MIEKKIKLLSILPSLGKGGAEVQVVSLVNALDARYFDKYLITFESNKSLLPLIDHSSVKHSLYSRERNNIFYVAMKVAKFIKKNQIDLIHCSLQVALLVGWLSRLLTLKKPILVVTLHTTLHRGWRDELYEKLIYQWLLRCCDCVIFVCHNQFTHWKNKYPFLIDRSAVIYNGININHFSPDSFADRKASIREELGLKETDIVVCNIAAFRPEKGQSILLDAFRKVIKQIPDAVLLLVGGGIARNKIETQANEYGFGDRVKFIGIKDDVRPILAVSSLSVQASTAVETFSLAMLESLSMEIPMVATNIGGTSEAIKNYETGILVEPNNVDVLAESIIYFLELISHDVSIKQNCRKLVRENFSEHKMVSRYHNEFSRLMRS